MKQWLKNLLNGKRRNLGKSVAALGLSLLLVLSACLPVSAVPQNSTESAVECKSAILMEASTGKILFEQNADEALPPASVTKVMTLLLVMEEIEAGRLQYDDPITASAHACSMGGSQIFLKEGEVMSAEDMIKSVVIASANDAAVALAEHVSGSEEAFVERMNQRAAELGMKNTHFENTNGLDDTAENHVTSARDIALMSQALLRYDRITEFSSIWMDTIRNGEFGLTNTNRLVRFYRGATGLKTGSTSKAGFCISATAKRDDMSLICVIMGAPSRDIRNATATKLLDFGFANYTLYRQPAGRIEGIRVKGGESDSLNASYPEFCSVVKKSDAGRIESKTELPESVSAPIQKGASLGRIVYTLDGQELGVSEISAEETVKKISFFGIVWRILEGMTLC